VEGRVERGHLILFIGLVGMGGNLSQIGISGSRHPVTNSRPTACGIKPRQPKETMMRFYTKPHQFYCGIDLHARLPGPVHRRSDRRHRLAKATASGEAIAARPIAPYRPDVVVAVECLFAWYWVADLCRMRRSRSSWTCAVHEGDPRRQGQERRHRRREDRPVPQRRQHSVAYVTPRPARNARSVAPAHVLRCINARP